MFIHQITITTNVTTLAGASAGGNDYYVDLYQKGLKSYGIEGLNIQYVSQQVRHIDAARPSFDYALDMIFPESVVVTPGNGK